MERTLSRVELPSGQAQQIIVKTVLLIPHPIFARLVHSPCDPQEVIGKRGGDVNICGVGTSQLAGQLSHVLAK